MKRFWQSLGKVINHPLLWGFLLFFMLLSLTVFGLFVPLDRLGYDLMLYKRGDKRPATVVTIVDIDEKSLRALGRWPWPRPVLTELLQKLNALKAKVIAFDMTFSEADHNRQADQQLVAVLNNDQSQVVIGFFMQFLGSGLGRGVEEGVEDEADFMARLQTITDSALNAADMSSGSFQVAKLYPDPVYLTVPLPEVARTRAHFAYLNNFQDDDNISRSYHPFHPIRNHYFASLGLKAASLYLEATPQLRFEADGAIELNLLAKSGDLVRDIPLDHRARLPLNFYGTVRKFNYVSAVDILQGKVRDTQIADKIIFVGSSALGVHDLVKVPTGSFQKQLTPGVEVHATLAANILQQQYLVSDEWVTLLLRLIVPIVAILLFVQAGPALCFGLAIALMVGEIALTSWLLNEHGRTTMVATPLLYIFFLYVGMTLMKYRDEAAKRRFIKNAFAHYLSPQVITQIVNNPDSLQLRGERRELTILFSDIRDFSSLSEQLTPQALHELLVSYLTPMTDIILENQGTLDKYIGDAIMAFYGAPLPFNDHAKRCCQSALKMLAALKKLRETPNFPPLQIGIGINSGEVSVGNMGSLRLFDYTVVGDAVNLASRLEGTNKLYGTSIIVSAATRQQCLNDFAFRELDQVQVKGKQEVVTIFELMNQPQNLLADEQRLIQEFHDGLGFYREQRFQEAKSKFEACLRLHPLDHPAKLYLERLEVLREWDAKDPRLTQWDGIYRFESK